jgi:hypothetical protein
MSWSSTTAAIIPITPMSTGPGLQRDRMPLWAFPACYRLPPLDYLRSIGSSSRCICWA